MEASNKDTLSTLKHLKAFEKMSSDEVKTEAAKVLQ